jgi:hypothetical protein
MDKNVCPYCGGTNIEAIRSDIHNNKKVPHQPNVHHYARCGDCGLTGPYVQAEDDSGIWYYKSWGDAQQAAIHTFTHPAHLMASLHTYDPATHIVVSRETGERVAKIIEYDVCGRENCKCGELAAELRAALEVK